MIPTAVTGTWTNLKHGIVDLTSGLLVGIGAVIAAPVGVAVAARISPATGSVLFDLFVVINMLLKERARQRARAAAVSTSLRPHD